MPLKRGIWVTNTPGVLHETTADLTWAMILGAARRIVPSRTASLRESRFKRMAGEKCFWGEIFMEKLLGIIGCGENWAQAVARRASGFNMRVLYHATATDCRQKRNVI